jgi:RNA polymerase sigma-70 factor (ECF subfamily)
VDRSLFITHLQALVPVNGRTQEDLDALHLEDLYLACACLAGQKGAISVLDRDYLGRACLGLPGVSPGADQEHEVRQALRTRLLLAQDGKPPRLAAYAGKGPLGAWLRVAAARMLTDLRRADRPRGRDSLAPALVSADPELAFLKRRYSPELAFALEATIAELPPKERTVLRLHYFEGMSTYSIAKMYGVHGTTIVRWLARARDTIIQDTRARLRKKLAIEDEELDTLIGLAQSQLNFSIRRYLTS